MLHRALADADEGRGGLVAVSGEAGVGKSTLVGAFVEQLPSGVRASTGACDALATPRPMGPLLDIVADLDLDSVVAGATGPHEIYARFLAWLAEATRPVVVVIEDVHWADAATNDLLLFLGRRIRSTRALVVATYRDDEVGRDHPLRQVMADIPGLERLAVKPLTHHAVNTLAAEAGVDGDAVYQVAGGNAFFVTEILATDDAVPATVYDAVLARVARLPDRARRLVDVVAVSTNAVNVEIALGIADVTAIEARLALDAGVLVADGNRLRFRHELARTVVYESMNPAERLEYHRRYLGRELDGDEPDPARATHHAVAIGEDETVEQWAPRAAELARNRRSHREAIDFYSVAISVGHGAQLAEWLTARAEQHRLAGHADLALGDAEEAVRVARRAGEPGTTAGALVGLAVAMTSHNRTADADPVLVEALELYVDADDGHGLTVAAFHRAFNAMLARQRDLATRRLAEANEHLALIESDELRLQSRLLDAYIKIITGTEEAGYRLLKRIESDTHRSGRDAPMTFLSNMGSGLGEIRRYDEAVRYLEESIDVGRQFDEDFGIGYARAWLARIQFETGHWDKAAHLASAVLDRPRLFYSTITAAGALGRTRVRRGDPHGVDLLTRTLRDIDGTWLQQRWPLAAGVAEYHWLSGDPEAAIEIVAEPLAEALDTDSLWCRGEMALWGWLVGAIDDAPDRVAEPFRLHIGGEWQAAADLWAEIGCPYEQALALAFGDEAMMLQGLELLHTLQAAPAAAWLRARLRSAGVTSIPRGPRSSNRDTPFGLTARQAEVLELMRDGLSNPEIGDRLFISKRTVEHHVSAIMAKVGVSTRAEVMAKAAQQEPT